MMVPRRKCFLATLLFSILALQLLLPAAARAAQNSVEVENHTQGDGLQVVSGIAIDGVDGPQAGSALDTSALVTTAEDESWEIPVLWVRDDLEIATEATEATEGHTYLPALPFFVPVEYVVEGSPFTVTLSDSLSSLFGSSDIISIYNASTRISYIVPASLRSLFGGQPQPYVGPSGDDPEEPSEAVSVSYIERSWNGTKVVQVAKDCTATLAINDNTVHLQDGGWYFVNGIVVLDNRLSADGVANIILCDGARLQLNDGIEVSAGSALNIYGQSGGSGELYCFADTNDNAAIGSNDEKGDCGTVVIHGGKVTANTAEKGEEGAGIGGGDEANGGTVIIYGGTVNAQGGTNGAGIGGGCNGSGGSISIYGGTVNAQGGTNGAGIGGGCNGSGGSISIYGGTVNAQGGTYGAGIGGGYSGSSGIVSINGGDVTATGGIGGAGIGTGLACDASGDVVNVTISGGVVTARGGNSYSKNKDGEGRPYLEYPGAGIGAGGCRDLESEGSRVGHSYFTGAINLNGGTVDAYVTNDNNYSCATIGGIELGNAATIAVKSGCTVKVRQNGSEYQGRALFKAKAVVFVDSDGQGSRVRNLNKLSEIALANERVAWCQSEDSSLELLIEPCNHGSVTLLEHEDNHSTSCLHCGVDLGSAEDHAYGEPVFSLSGDGATVTATWTCACGHTRASSLTIAAPPHMRCGDGKDAAAVITDDEANPILGDAQVHYYTVDLPGDGRGIPLDPITMAPEDAGTYWAELTIGTGDNSVTAHVIYTIASRAACPATITGAATVMAGDGVDLANNIEKNGTTGDVSYEIVGAAPGCSLDGSILKTSSTASGTVTVRVSVAADDSFEATTATITVTITEKAQQTSIAKAKVTLERASYTCDGKAKTPAVKSVVLGGRTLRAGTDYAVSYGDNVGVGTATVTVTGRGDYAGSARATFAIGLAGAKAPSAEYKGGSSASVSWEKVPGAGGYQLQYRQAGGRWRTLAAKGASKTVKGLRTGKLYQFRVRATAGKSAGAWSKACHHYHRRVSGLAASVKRPGTVTASWKADPKANAGYVVLVRYEKDGKVVARASVAKGKTKATVKGLKKGRRYLVQVRPMRKSGDKTYTGALKGVWAKGKSSK